MKRVYKYISFLVLQVMLLTAVDASAQYDKNIIYLFDCTGSMITNGLWEPAKSALDGTITTESSIDGSQFTIIPFGDEPYETISFGSSKYTSKKNDIAKAFDKYVKQSKYTRISDVLGAGFKLTDGNKDNTIYLLTDGMPNQGDTPEKVAETISRWCSNHRNTRLFYVALKPGAVNSVIKSAIDACDDAYVVELEGGIIPQFTYISSHLYTNTGDLGREMSIDFGLPGNYPVKIQGGDELFELQAVDGCARDGKIAVKLVARDGRDASDLHSIMQGDDDEFVITVQCTDPRFYISNPHLRVSVADGVQSRFTLAGGYEHLKTDGVKWYDSFLWSDAAPDTQVGWDLEPVFENGSASSAIAFQVEPDDDQPRDFTVWFNDTEIAPGESFVINRGDKAFLEVLFDHDAQTGKRYIKLIPVGARDIDLINDRPTGEYEGTVIRTSYTVDWNPLAVLLLWLGILLLGLLVLWLLVLKRIFFPTIKVGRVEMTGPGSYYQSKRLKGARKVVLTSRKRSQGFISRVMTGEIRYVRADHFSPEIEIEPSGAKKKVKVRSAGTGDNGWDIFPTSIYAPYDKGTLVNRITKDKTEIEFS